MYNTDPVYGLGEMLEYLDGLGSSGNRVDDARIGLDYLVSRGFILVYGAGPPVIRSVSPDDLRAVRKALRLSNMRLAEEAGLSITAVVRAQKVGAPLARQRTLDAILAVFLRMGASIPEPKQVPDLAPAPDC